MPDYWDAYYRNASKDLASPSQFAVFALSELRGQNLIVDIGCGNGRDSLFFASHGLNVVGIDASVSAIDYCSEQAERLGLSNAKFHRYVIGDPHLLAKLVVACQGQSVCVYARFFLHAIDEEAEKHFLDLAAKLTGLGGLVAVEFRTVRDASQTKVTPNHYRRFLEPVKFLSTASDAGLKLNYFIEGFGYAKYKADDAHVARCIFCSQ